MIREMEACAHTLLQRLLISSVILGEDWEAVPDERRTDMLECPDVHELLDRLVAETC